MRTFNVKLSCMNCGMEAFYKLPFKSDIRGYRWDEDEEERFSHYTLNDDEYDLDCMNCGLTYLTGSTFWEEKIPDGLRESDKRSEISSTSQRSGEM